MCTSVWLKINKASLKQLHYQLAFCLLTCFLLSCKKFVDIAPPPDKINTRTAFNSDATATAAITGIYSEMGENMEQFSSGYTTLFCGLSADELFYYTPDFRDEFLHNEITAANHSNLTSYFWMPAYKYIYAANLAIEQLQQARVLTPAVQQALLGEAKFIRAFCYFHLVNLFGAVPLATTSDYRVNVTLPRSPEKAVYAQIVQDLTEARSVLPDAFSSGDKSRPGKWAATALLARVSLYTGDWQEAVSWSSAVLSSGHYALEANLQAVFLKNSTEPIWQLVAGNPFVGTWEGYHILPPSESATPTYLITPFLLSSFESSDERKQAWIGARTYLNDSLFYPSKYRMYPDGSPVTEYYAVLRLAEMYLIRAEANAHLNKLTEGENDVNAIRNRAGLPSISFADQVALLTGVVHERQMELFAEWGHRWFDLKRTGQINAVLSTLKPTWQPSDTLWPVPIDQIRLNPALTQNPGY